MAVCLPALETQYVTSVKYKYLLVSDLSRVAMQSIDSEAVKLESTSVFVGSSCKL